MPLYEHVYLARQDITTQQVEAINNTIEDLIKKDGGSIDKVEYWGLRQLAYKIKKNRKAHYTLMNINAPSDTLKNGQANKPKRKCAEAFDCKSE